MSCETIKLWKDSMTFSRPIQLVFVLLDKESSGGYNFGFLAQHHINNTNYVAH